MLDSFDLSYEELKRIDQVCDEFENQLAAGQKPSIEELVNNETDDLIRHHLLANLIASEIDHSATGFNQQNYTIYSNRFSDYQTAVDSVFRDRDLTNMVDDMQKTIISHSSQDPTLRLQPGSSFGKYRIINCIGKGMFGIVYRAYDTELERDVALKLSRFAETESNRVQERFIEEAKSAAQINANGVATIYDLFTDDHRICIVQEFIDGLSLSQLIAGKKLNVEKSVNLAIAIADAIGSAHDQGIFHRDLKPGNIIIDRVGEPTLVDFGLALRNNSPSNPVGLFGTPGYMSPEQVRGESNRTDSTTDIWALGIILYEMLTGVRPFDRSNQEDMFEAIQGEEPIPLPEINASIPTELNRITLKCISKRKHDRYKDAGQLALDLRRFLNGEVGQKVDSFSNLIVPKGLRSFSEEDSRFYLSLLPGPRDYSGVPESISFWARQIENPDALDTFFVGLIYGASGCGKSSFVKAGLIPLLPARIKTIYIEANQFDTELRFLSKLRKLFPAISEHTSLPETIAMIRDGDHLEFDEKLLVVIDQFEQWLAFNNYARETQLGNALRHCDGGRVQVLLLIREDFWPSASRFMEQIEVPLIQNENCRAIELFDRTHASKLLFELGRAHHRFENEQPTQQQSEFVEKVVDDLAKHDRILGSRLAMFTEAFRDKPWTLQSLQEFGGADGAGVAFLNESFVLPSAPAAYKVHKKAVFSSLDALLPETGSDLKGHMRSRGELVALSGYENEPSKFDQLIDVLEKDMRLITSTEPVEKATVEGDSTEAGDAYYQLSHDYLVPVVRRWIDIEDRRYLQGKIEARMNEIAQIWGEAKHSRYLPTWWETAKILLFSRWKKWSKLHHKMMVASFKKHAVTTALVFAVVVGLLIAGVKGWRNYQITSQVSELKNSMISDVDDRVKALQPWKNVVVPLIHQELGKIESIHPRSDEHRAMLKKQNLNLSLAMASLNGSNWNEVVNGIGIVPEGQLKWLARFLAPFQAEASERLVKELSAIVDGGNQHDYRKAVMLSQWGRPNYLARLLTFRDSEEVQTALPLLMKTPKQSISALNKIASELKSQVFENCSNELERIIAKHDGAINRFGGFAASVPNDEVDNLLLELFEEGYSPASMRPYFMNDQALTAMTFRRGIHFETGYSGSVRYKSDLTKAELEKLNRELSKDGWSIVDISQFVNRNDFGKKPSLSALWLRSDQMPEIILELDVSDEFLVASTEKRAKDGFQIERMFARPSSTGTPQYSIIWSCSQDQKGKKQSEIPIRISFATGAANSNSGAAYADYQLSPIDVSQRDRFRIYREKLPWVDAEQMYLVDGEKIPQNLASSMDQYASLLARLELVDEARRCYDKVIADNPGWIGTDLEYVKFLSRLGDREGYDKELKRIKEIGLTPTQEKVRVPISELRFAVAVDDFDQAKAKYDALNSKFDELEKEYRNKPSSIVYINSSRIRINFLFAKLQPEGSKEFNRLIEDGINRLKLLKNINFMYFVIDPDHDIARFHERYQEFIRSLGYGIRTNESWRLDPGRSTRLDLAASLPRLIEDAKAAMSEGFVPKTIACQQYIGNTRIGTLVSERQGTDTKTSLMNKKRLARAALMLDNLGQSKLLESIRNGEFGTEIQYLLPAEN